jgi:ribosomal protein S18 acetylase RimI-like enzyme
MPEVIGAVSIEEIALLERCALNGWPAPFSRMVMGWALRSANGYTKRANSANPVSPAGDFAMLRGEVEAHYAALGLPAMFRLSPLAPPGADAALAAAGYAIDDPALVMVASLDHAAADHEVTIVSHADEAWLAGFAEAASESARTISDHAAIPGAIRAPRAFASIVRDGRMVAFGFAVADEGRVGVFDIAVHPSHRGRGLARTLSAALLAWGRSFGAKSAYLQVRAANSAALCTYTGLGFSEAYRYNFRIAPASGYGSGPG